MGVKTWLPWVAAGIGGYVVLQNAGLLRGNVIRGEEDRVPTGGGGDSGVSGLVGTLANLLGGVQGSIGTLALGQESLAAGQLSQQAGIGGALDALFTRIQDVADRPINIEIPGFEQAVNAFATPASTLVNQTPVVSELGYQKGTSGEIGAWVRKSVYEGTPVPEALVTWVTTNRRGLNPGTSGRNYETHPLLPHERAQVRAAIGMGASVVKELVDAFNAGQGMGETASFLGVKNKKQSQSNKSQISDQQPLSPVTEVIPNGQALDQETRLGVGPMNEEELETLLTRTGEAVTAAVDRVVVGATPLVDTMTRMRIKLQNLRIGDIPDMELRPLNIPKVPIPNMELSAFGFDEWADEWEGLPQIVTDPQQALEDAGRAALARTWDGVKSRVWEGVRKATLGTLSPIGGSQR